MPALSNIREILGWMIGCRVADVTAGDPDGIPDAEVGEGDFIVLHFDNGGTLTVPVTDEGVGYYDPDEPDDEDEGTP